MINKLHALAIVIMIASVFMIVVLFSNIYLLLNYYNLPNLSGAIISKIQNISSDSKLCVLVDLPPNLLIDILKIRIAINEIIVSPDKLAIRKNLVGDYLWGPFIRWDGTYDEVCITNPYIKQDKINKISIFIAYSIFEYKGINIEYKFTSIEKD